MAEATLDQVTDTTPEKPQSDYERPEEVLQRYFLSLTNARNSPEILNVLKEYRYDEQRLDEGLALHTTVSSLMAGQKKEKGEQLQASKDLESCYSKARERFMVTRSIAKANFDTDPNAFAALQLSGRTLTSISGVTKQATPFYSNLIQNQSFAALMENYGYTSEKLAEEKGLIQAMLDADARHKKELGEALESTKIRDEAFEKLDDWMTKFYTVVKAVFKKKPELLRQLGM